VPANRPPDSQIGPVLWNEQVPSFLSDSQWLQQLRLFGPEWLRQNLTWPNEVEQRIHEADSTNEQRLAFMQWMVDLLRIQIPGELVRFIVEMADWQLVMRDWTNQPGADAFLVRFRSSGYAIHISDIPSAMIIVARPIDLSRFTNANNRDFAMQVAEDLLERPLLPVGPESVFSNEVPMLSGAVEGSWKVSAMGELRRKFQPDESKRPPIRFFSQGELAAFMIPKTLFALDGEDQAALERQSRFQRPVDSPDTELLLSMMDEQMARSPLLSDPGGRLAYFEQLRRTLNIRTVEEFLGPMMFDRDGQRLQVESLSYDVLSREIEELTADQREILLRQRRVDWFYLEGLKNFEQNKLDAALEAWSQALALDPLNVRVAVLMEVAAARRLNLEFAGDAQKASLDVLQFNVSELLAFHTQKVARHAMQQQEEERRMQRVSALRAEAMAMFRDGLYESSLTKWQEILRIDPNNSVALLYSAICSSRLETAGTSPTTSSVAAAAPVVPR